MNPVDSALVAGAIGIAVTIAMTKLNSTKKEPKPVMARSTDTSHEQTAAPAEVPKKDSATDHGSDNKSSHKSEVHHDEKKVKTILLTAYLWLKRGLYVGAIIIFALVAIDWLSEGAVVQNASSFFKSLTFNHLLLFAIAIVLLWSKSKVARVVGSSILILLLLFWEDAYAVVEHWKNEIKAMVMNRSLNTNDLKATWDEYEVGGSIPINVWSNTYELGIGCKSQFNGANGVSYKVRYQLYSDEWINHVPGTHPPMSHMQFAAITKNVTEVSFRVTCK